MAVINKIIINPLTGQTYKFLQTSKSTNGKLLEIESGFSPNSKEPPAHYHPIQAEDFTVLQGTLTVRIGTTLQTLQQGERLHITPSQVHAMWNQSDSICIVNWKTQPALQSEYFFETLTGLAIDQKTDAAGRPGLLQSVITLNKFHNEFKLAKPLFFVQNIAFKCLSPFAYLLGYKPVYSKYLD